jgi:hypothetical protein
MCSNSISHSRSWSLSSSSSHGLYVWSGLDGGVEFLLSWLSSSIRRLRRIASFGNSLSSSQILSSSSSDEFVG